jgi:hypothetical protein
MVDFRCRSGGRISEVTLRKPHEISREYRLEVQESRRMWKFKRVQQSVEVQESAEAQECRRAPRGQKSVEVQEPGERGTQKVQECGIPRESLKNQEERGPRGQEVEAQESVEAQEYRRAQESVEL